MKRLLLPLSCLWLLCGCGLTDDEQEDRNKSYYLSFPDPAFETWCLTHCDRDGDGRVSRYEAQHTVEIACPSLGIASLQGIEEFTALRRIDCSDNDLDVFDARPFPYLERLDVSGNGRLGDLRTDALRYLLELRCDGCALGNLYLGDNASLMALDAGGNRLTTLDVCGCARYMERVTARDNSSLSVFYRDVSQRIDLLLLDGSVEIVER